jgi:polysaccharide pyruvyl transferase CsaB
LFKRAKKFFIYGIYGAGNIGDEAILQSILLHLKKITNYQKIIISKKPDVIYNEYQKPSIHPLLYSKISHLLNKRSNSSILLMGGGGILKDYGNSPATLKKFLKVPMVGLKNKYKTMLYSAGVEKIIFKESRILLADILNQFDILTVRDPYSKERLEELGVQKQIYVTGDPAVLLFLDIGNNKIFKKNNPLIIVTLRHWFEKGYFHTDERIFNQFLLKFAYSLDKIIEEFNASILFIPFRIVPFDNDNKIIQAVKSKMKYTQKVSLLEKIPSYAYLNKIYSLADVTIGMRLHSLIFSFSSLTPMVAISYSCKIKDFMNYINLEDFSFNINDFVPEHLFNKIEYIFNNKEEINHSLYFKRKEYLDKLNKNIILLQDLL